MCNKEKTVRPVYGTAVEQTERKCDISDHYASGDFLRPFVCTHASLYTVTVYVWVLKVGFALSSTAEEAVDKNMSITRKFGDL